MEAKMGKLKQIVQRVKELKAIIAEKAVVLNTDISKTPKERYHLSMEIRGHHEEVRKLKEEFKS